MKLLILAQTPPPLHGQSLMVETAVRGLPARGIEVHHVNLRLSRGHADIGGWRPGKVLAILDACFHAIAARFTERCDTLYYVPAPGKRGALYRDWLVMLLVRPFYRRLVLHFHNGGLGEWLARDVTAWERGVTQALLGRADLAIVLADSLKGDAEALVAQTVSVVPNGIEDPSPPQGGGARCPAEGRPFHVIFLGQGSDEKGLFVTVEAITRANLIRGPGAFDLTVAGSFPGPRTAARFHEIAAAHRDCVRHVGFLNAREISGLMARCDCLCLPTRYPHEGQPLVLLEALAHDLPVVASRWRAIPETLAGGGVLTDSVDPQSLAQALTRLRENRPAAGLNRERFLRHFTASTHLGALSAALRGLAEPREPQGFRTTSPLLHLKLRPEGRTKPTISVVLPTCDRPALVGRALSSILSQGWEDFEVLLVDANRRSPPVRENRALGSMLCDPRVRVIDGRATYSSATARNAGIRAATGEWITFLDDDDEYRPEKLAAQLALARETGSPFVVCGYEFVWRWRRRQRQIDRTCYSGDALLTHLQPNTPLLFFRRDSALTFDERLQAGEDTNLGIDLIRHYRLEAVPCVPRALVVVHPQSGGKNVHANREAVWLGYKAAWRRARPHFSRKASRALLALGQLERAMYGHGSTRHFIGSVQAALRARGRREFRLAVFAVIRRYFLR